METFAEWLTSQLNKRKMSMRELGRRSGFSHAQISNVASRQSPASADFCVAIARALSEAPEGLLRLAGILPPTVEQQRHNDPLLDHLIVCYTGLSPGDRSIAVRLVRGLDATASTGHNPRPLEEVEQRRPAPEGGRGTNNPGIEPDPYAPYIEVLAEIWDSLTVEQMEQSIEDYVRLVWEHLPEHVKATYCKISAHLGE